MHSSCSLFVSIFSKSEWMVVLPRILCGQLPIPVFVLIWPRSHAVWSARPGFSLSPVPLYQHGCSFPLGMGNCSKPIPVFPGSDVGLRPCHQCLSVLCLPFPLCEWMGVVLLSSGLATAHSACNSAMVWFIETFRSIVWGRQQECQWFNFSSLYLWLVPKVIHQDKDQNSQPSIDGLSFVNKSCV